MDYLPLIPNKSIKFIKHKKINYKDSDFPISNILNEVKHKKFQNWVESPLKTRDISCTGKYIGRYTYHNNNLVLKKKYLNYFISELENIISKNGYTIINNKEFRDTIASFIYNLSN